VGAAVLAAGQTRSAAFVGSLVAACVVFVAALGPPRRPDIIDEWDPLPSPGPPPTPPSPAPPDTSPTTKGSIPLSMSWYFRRDPLALADVTQFTIELEASKARYEQRRGHDHSVRHLRDY